MTLENENVSNKNIMKKRIKQLVGTMSIVFGKEFNQELTEITE
jgi:hypothetical protein